MSFVEQCYLGMVATLFVSFALLLGALSWLDTRRDPPGS
jgi:hypothetical protein